MFRKRVPGVGSGNRKSSAADGSQSDWRHDQRVSSGRAQSSSTRDINCRGERPQIPWCVAVEDSVCQHGDFELNSLRHTQPMSTDKSVSNVVGAYEVENQPCGSVQC